MGDYRKVSRRRFIKGASAGFVLGMGGLYNKNTQKGEKPIISMKKISKISISKKLIRNARIVLEVSCRAKAGESLLIIGDEVLLPYAPALASAAIELGLIPTIMDITHFLSTDSYQNGFVLKPLKEAIESSDIVIQNLADTWVKNRPDFGRLVGDPDLHDKSLSGERRWMIIQCNGIEEWEIAPEEVLKIRIRTEWLLNLLKSSKTGTITSSLGTDFTFGLGPNSNLSPILGIIPFYGEIAVTPSLENTSGTFIVDGPTQLDVRPANELDRKPLMITVKDGRVKDVIGDKVQLKRLREFIASGVPPADAIDEVGILTTTLEENDKYYWSDGTHHHDRIHIALGNNVRRDTVVHGPKHMDCEVCKPTISIDGLIVIENGIFKDEVLKRTGK